MTPQFWLTLALGLWAAIMTMAVCFVMDTHERGQTTNTRMVHFMVAGLVAVGFVAFLGLTDWADQRAKAQKAQAVQEQTP